MSMPDTLQPSARPMRPRASAAVFNLLPYMCVKGRDELLALHQEKLLPELRQ